MKCGAVEEGDCNPILFLLKIYGVAIVLGFFCVPFLIYFVISFNGLFFGEYNAIVMTNVYGEHWLEVFLLVTGTYAFWRTRHIKLHVIRKHVLRKRKVKACLDQ